MKSNALPVILIIQYRDKLLVAKEGSCDTRGRKTFFAPNSFVRGNDYRISTLKSSYSLLWILFFVFFFCYIFC